MPAASRSCFRAPCGTTSFMACAWRPPRPRRRARRRSAGLPRRDGPATRSRTWRPAGSTPGGAALDATLIDLLKRTGFEEDIYRFGLSGRVDPNADPELTGQLVKARARFRDKLAEEGMDDFVEPFDPSRYNTRATLAENLLFGVPTSPGLMGRDLAEHEGFRQALDRARLTEDLIRMGVTIAE